MAKMPRNADVLKQRDWSKNSAVFILNMMRAEVYSNYEQIDQGYSTSKMFESHKKDCIVSLCIEGKDWLLYNNEKNIQVKYKVRNAAKKLSKYLINKNILNKSNYTDIKYKIFVLDKGFLPFNNMVLTKNSQFIIFNKPPEEFEGEPYNFQYFEGQRQQDKFITNFS